MDGTLLVIDMLGNTISALRTQLATAQEEIATLRQQAANRDQPPT